MTKNNKIALGVAAGLAALLYATRKRPQGLNGISGTTGARIVDNVELMSNCESAEEIEKRLKDYVERHRGHVVNSITEAYEYFRDVYGKKLDFDNVHYGDTQFSTFTLDSEDRYGYIPTIRVIIDEIYVDPGSDDYCYMVRAEEE